MRSRGEHDRAGSSAALHFSVLSVSGRGLYGCTPRQACIPQRWDLGLTALPNDRSSDPIQGEMGRNPKMCTGPQTNPKRASFPAVVASSLARPGSARRSPPPTPWTAAGDDMGEDVQLQRAIFASLQAGSRSAPRPRPAAGGGGQLGSGAFGVALRGGSGERCARAMRQGRRVCMRVDV